MSTSINRRQNLPVNSWIRSIYPCSPILITILEIKMGNKEELNTQINEAEIYWISYFKGVGSPLLNLTMGGDGVVGREVTDQNRQQASLMMKNKWKNSEYRANNIKKNRGKRHSDDTKRLLSVKSKNSVKVFGSDGTEYRSITDLSIHLNVNMSTLSKNISSGKIINGVIYTKEVVNVTFYKKQGKPVYCSNGKKYENYKEAMKDLKLKSPDCILKSANNQRRIGGKYKFSWTDDENLTQYKPKDRVSARRMPIISDDGTIYESILHAAKALNIRASSIQKVLYGEVSQYKGRRFAYLSDGKPEKPTKNTGKLRTIISSDGATFIGAKEAALHYKVGRSTITQAINKNYPLKSGIRLRYQE